MSRFHRHHLVFFAVCIILGALILHGRDSSLNFANASIERLCASTRFVGTTHAVENAPSGPPEKASAPELDVKPESEDIVGLHVDSLTRKWSQHETRFVRGLPGFMMFENLYLHNGTLYAITSLREAIPRTANILSDPPIPLEDYDQHPPATAQRWRVITPVEADDLFGKQGAGVLAGTSFLFNDGPGKRGYLGHYFHFVAEAFAGAWRVHTSSPLNLHLNSAKDTVLPARLMFPRGNDWRDVRANLNVWFLSTILPNTAVEDIYQWEDRANSNSVHVFSHVIIVDRWTALRVPGSEAQLWNKMTADIMGTPAPFDWFLTLRTSLMQRLGIEGNERDRPVITYIDRQATDRKLIQEDHDALMDVLTKIGEEKGVEINAIQMEYLSKAEQFDISTRTDIMIGVHGNGLSHQMWMKPGSVVLEFFDIGGFARDYQLLAEAMHHTHHVVWNDTINETWRAEKKVVMTENFNNVRLYAPFMYGTLGGLVDRLRASKRRP